MKKKKIFACITNLLRYCIESKRLTRISNFHYYTTKLLGGLIQKIHQTRSRDCRSDIFQVSDRFRAYQTGNRTFQNGGCGGDRGLQTFSSKHKAILVQATKAPLWAWFGHVKQSGKTRGSCWTWKRRSHYEQQLIGALQDFIEEHKSNLTRWGKLSRSHLAWSALVERWIRQKNRNYSVNYSCTRNPTNTISLILAIFARWVLVAFAVLVFSNTKSRVINLLLTEFARAVLREYRPSVFLVRTSPKRLGPYCQDLGPIFSQYGPRTRSIRYMYCWENI